MCTILQPRHHQAQKHRTAATLRRSKVVILLAVSAPAFLASGALAQVQETAPPVLSSGLREATPAQTSVTSKLSQRPATPTLFDAASLPPIESIGAGSDIRPFLEPGVPQDLARAALHRAWAADPAIRDFIGLSENSSGFNAPDAVPGFGSLTTHDAGRLPARVLEELLGASGDGATSPNKSGR
jgi:hypothetical protein